MYADESYSYVQKDEMDRKVLETEGHVSSALCDLFNEVRLPPAAGILQSQKTVRSCFGSSGCTAMSAVVEKDPQGF